MKSIKTMISVTALCLVAAGKPMASGFPTVDVAQVAQNLTDYISQLEQLQTQVESASFLDAQLVQQLIEWEQTLTEYQHLLNMMEGLPDDIEAFGDHVDFSVDPITGKWNIGVLTDKGYKDVDDAIAQVWVRTREMADIEDDLTDAGYSGAQYDRKQLEASRAYAMSRLEPARQHQSRNFSDVLQKERELFTDKISPQVSILQRESENELQVMQMTMVQNQAIIKQLQDINEILTTDYREGDKLAADVFAKRARSQERRRCVIDAAINDTSNAGC